MKQLIKKIINWIKKLFCEKDIKITIENKEEAKK
jgi:hypothetical protein